MPTEIANNSVSQVFEVAHQLESLGIVGVFFVMLAVAIGANYFLFKHAMANCGGMKEIYQALESLSKAIEKTNETQRLSIEIIKEFSERETKVMRASLARETNPIKNYHNAFASIYEGRYLAGIVAGQKMKEDIEANKYTAEEAKIGYVGAHPYAEVISGFTSFYLGAKSVVPSVTMEVRYTNSWYDYTAENNTAKQLIDDGCKLISQHADSYGAPNACEEKGVPNVTYNGSTAQQCPDTYLVSSKIDWAPYYKHIIDCVQNGKAIETDYVGTVKGGSVKITEYGKHVSEEAKTLVTTAKDKLNSGELHVFDTTKFTVNNGETPTNENMSPNKQYTYNYPEGTEFVKDGYYHESYYRSAPSFDVIIDGITSISN